MSKIKAIAKNYKTALIENNGEEKWTQISQGYLDKVEDKESWRKELWGAIVDLTLTGDFITGVKLIEKAKQNPQTPSQEKDDYWTKKFNYEKDIRDVSLKLKGETDQALKIVELSLQHSVAVSEIINTINDAKKQLFGE